MAFITNVDELQTQIYKQNTYTQKVELKSLYFNLVYVFLFSSKTRIYINKPHLHGVELKTLFQFCLTFSPFYLEEMKKLFKSQRFTRL